MVYVKCGRVAQLVEQCPFNVCMYGNSTTWKPWEPPQVVASPSISCGCGMGCGMEFVTVRGPAIVAHVHAAHEAPCPVVAVSHAFLA